MIFADIIKFKISSFWAETCSIYALNHKNSQFIASFLGLGQRSGGILCLQDEEDSSLNKQFSEKSFISAIKPNCL